VTLEQLVNEIIRVFAGEESVEKTYRPEMASQPNFTFDMSKTEADFGYQPQYDLRSMLMDIRDSVDPAVWLTSDL
jgi:UDP-glucose 4-epimerase